MECPTCDGDVDVTLMNTEVDAEEDGIEVNFCCPWCRRDFFAVLKKINFVQID